MTNPLTPTPLAQLLSTRAVQADRVGFDIPADWLQGRTSFGGLVSTLAVQAMRDVAGAAWPAEVRLRALQTAFIGPVAMGPAEVVVTLLREGKHMRQVQARVLQAGHTAAVLLGVFGSGRATVIPGMSPEPPPVALQPAELPAHAAPEGMPQFLSHMDFRFAHGAAPFSRTPSTRSVIHLRLQGEPAPPDTELLTVLLADMPPTPVLSFHDKPTPASSVSWELQLRPLAQPPAAGGWWRVDTEALAAAEGYVNQATRLWAPSGELAALGYQVVAVFG